VTSGEDFNSLDANHLIENVDDCLCLESPTRKQFASMMMHFLMIAILIIDYREHSTMKSEE
jgi:hypothetical protein